MSSLDNTLKNIYRNVVGLTNVDNTSDLNKPISSLTQTALNAKLSLTGGTLTGGLTGTTATFSGPITANGGNFTGNITLPTISDITTNDNTASTTAFCQSMVNNKISTISLTPGPTGATGLAGPQGMTGPTGTAGEFSNLSSYLNNGYAQRGGVTQNKPYLNPFGMTVQNIPSSIIAVPFSSTNTPQTRDVNDVSGTYSTTGSYISGKYTGIGLNHELLSFDANQTWISTFKATFLSGSSNYFAFLFGVPYTSPNFGTSQWIMGSSSLASLRVNSNNAGNDSVNFSTGSFPTNTFTDLTNTNGVYITLARNTSGFLIVSAYTLTNVLIFTRTSTSTITYDTGRLLWGVYGENVTIQTTSHTLHRGCVLESNNLSFSSQSWLNAFGVAAAPQYYIMMTRTAALSIAGNSTVITIPWDTIRFTQGSSIAFNSSTNRFIIPETGLWTIEFMFSWDTSNTWSRNLMRIEHSTQGAILQSNQGKPNALPMSIQIVGTIPLTYGDEIWASIEQNSTASQICLVGIRTFISLRFNG